MRLAFAFLALAAAAAAFSSGATAQTYDLGESRIGQFSRAGLGDVPPIPAPIPVPAPTPVPEGFSYYIRTDFAYGFNASDPSFSESGRLYGTNGTSANFNAPQPFSFAGPQFASIVNHTDNSISGGLGFGAYFTPRLRGDVTLEFRGDRTTTGDAAYNYTSGVPAAVAGVLRDRLQVRSTLAMLNGYYDILPRGGFTPYVGAGVGIAYNQYTRTYADTETGNGASQFAGGSARGNNATFVGALLAGVTFAFDHRWAIDLNYRALYMQGFDSPVVVAGLTTAQQSNARLGDSWEHQVRIGLRFNIW